MVFTHRSGKIGLKTHERYSNKSGYGMCVLDVYFLNAAHGIVLSCIVHALIHRASILHLFMWQNVCAELQTRVN